MRSDCTPRSGPALRRRPPTGAHAPRTRSEGRKADSVSASESLLKEVGSDAL